MIEVENLSKRYGEKLAVDGLGFGCPAHRGLGRAVVMPNFDAGSPHIASAGMRGVVGGLG